MCGLYIYHDINKVNIAIIYLINESGVTVKMEKIFPRYIINGSNGFFRRRFVNQPVNVPLFYNKFLMGERAWGFGSPSLEA